LPDGSMCSMRGGPCTTNVDCCSGSGNCIGGTCQVITNAR
jgi:hypothetical protein